MKTKIPFPFPLFIQGVICRNPGYYPFLRTALTPEAVEHYFEHLLEKRIGTECRVKRYVFGMDHFKFFSLLTPEAVEYYFEHQLVKDRNRMPSKKVWFSYGSFFVINTRSCLALL